MNYSNYSHQSCAFRAFRRRNASRDFPATNQRPSSVLSDVTASTLEAALTGRVNIPEFLASFRLRRQFDMSRVSTNTWESRKNSRKLSRQSKLGEKQAPSWLVCRQIKIERKRACPARVNAPWCPFDFLVKGAFRLP